MLALLVPMDEYSFVKGGLTDIRGFPVLIFHFTAFAPRNAVEPFDLPTDLAWPFPVSDDPGLAVLPPNRITFSERVRVLIRHNLARAQASHPTATTPGDLTWVEEVIAEAGDALTDSFQPCFVMEDYKEGNLVVTAGDAGWYVSGVFDLMGGYFGDGEADLSRQTASYLDENPQLAREFLQAYLQGKPPRPGFDKRFPVYMLLDRAILWAYFQRSGVRWWDEDWTFRDWASRFTSVDVIP